MWEGSIRENESYFLAGTFRGRDVFTSNEAYEL
jgi:hypothetical protein